MIDEDVVQDSALVLLVCKRAGIDGRTCAWRKEEKIGLAGGMELDMMPWRKDAALSPVTETTARCGTGAYTGLERSFGRIVLDAFFKIMIM